MAFQGGKVAFGPLNLVLLPFALVWIGLALGVIGQARCLAMESEFPEARYLRLAVILETVSLAGSLWGTLALHGVLPDPPKLLTICHAFANFISQTCLLLFLVGLARFLKRPSLAASAGKILKWSLALVFGGPILVCLIASVYAALNLILVPIMLAVAVWLFYSYMKLLRTLSLALNPARTRR